MPKNTWKGRLDEVEAGPEDGSLTLTFVNEEINDVVSVSMTVKDALDFCVEVLKQTSIFYGRRFLALGMKR